MGHDLVRREVYIEPAGSDYGALVEGWLRHINKKLDTQVSYRRSLDLFAGWCEARGVTTVREEHVELWRAELLQSGHKGVSVNVYLSALRSFFRWAEKRGYVTSNPMLGIEGSSRRGQTKTHKRDELTADEVRAVLDGCAQPAADPFGARDGAMIALMAYAGLRTVEVHRADIGDVKTKGGRRILMVWGKNHDAKDDFVVLNASAEKALRVWLRHRRGADADEPLFISLSQRSRGERLSRVAIRGILKARFRAAGIDEATKTVHSLRHSAISTAIRAGATPTQAQAMARHANVNTTLIYYHETGRLTTPAEDLIEY
jgi:integrase/recombinase XerD